METQKIKGTIISIDSSETPDWKKWTYAIKDEQGKLNYLSLFISDKDFEHIKLKKESMISDFKKSDKVYATYTEKGKYKTLVELFDTEEKANEQYDVESIAQDEKDKEQEKPKVDIKKYPAQDLRIFKSQALNIAGSVIANAGINPEHPIVEEKLFKLAKRIYEKGLQEGFMEW